MSPFEIVNGYKPRKPIDLIRMAQHSRVSESTSAFASYSMNCINQSVKKFRKVMPIINLMLICTKTS